MGESTPYTSFVVGGIDPRWATTAGKRVFCM